MKTILNSYAVKAASEHPTAIWPMDDDVFFLSLIQNSDRLFTNWTKTNCSAVEQTDPGFIYPETLSAFEEDPYSTLSGNIPSSPVITGAVANGTYIEYTTSAAHGLYVGQTISVTGITPTNFAVNGVTVSATPTATKFRVLTTETGTYVSGGIVRYLVTMEAVSPVLFINSDLDSTKDTFAVNMYLYEDSVYVNSYEFGYKYTDSLLVDHEVISIVDGVGNGNWANFNFSFVLPAGTPTNFKVILRAKVFTGGSAGDYELTMNGFSVGQWSETTSARSLGANIVALPSSTGLVGYGAVADQYGILSNNAYYLVENNKLLAKNDSSPMIFGTDSLTRILPSTGGGPSFIFPGYGMLNETGRHKRQTLEAWIRINPNTVTSRRILGPLESDYGLYVRDNCLTLVIGDNIYSHPVGNWYRPMLVHIIFNTNSVSMLVNGEKVATVGFDRESIVLPDALNELSTGSDWWGVYSYSDIENFDIDCISIYPYVMSEQVAKKRFVWGQGTPSITSINNQYLGTSVYFDYSNSNYSVNAVYPDAYRWDAGYFNNFLASKKFISTPRYSLPEIFINDRDQSEWLSNNRAINLSEYPLGDHPKFFSLRPNHVTRTNLVTNPSFETATTGWTATGAGTTTSRTAGGVFGGYEMRVTNSAGVAGGIQSSNGYRVRVEAGETYTISAYLKKISGPDTVSIDLDVFWYDANTGGTVITSSDGPNTTLTGAWQRVNRTVTAPAGSTYLVLRISNSSAPAGSNVFAVDGVMVEKTDTLTNYFDGSYVDVSEKPISYGWNGTAHLSTSKLTYWNATGNDWTEQAYLYFGSLNILTDPLSAIYGVFEIEASFSTERPLMLFKNAINSDTFSITINGTTVSYKMNSDTLYTQEVYLDQHFAVGINIQALASYYGTKILDFFGSPSYVQMYVGGDGVSTFEGKIYRVGFSNQKNFQDISAYFMSNGITISTDDDILTEHFASYTLMPIERFGRFFLDISVSSQWEEYFPLSYFAKYVSDLEGDTYFDVDMLQINIGYQHKYELSGSNISIANSPLKTFLTFQTIDSGSNAPPDTFSATEQLSQRMVIDARNRTGYEAFDTKFEFIDGTIIYPPNDFPISKTTITVYFDLKQEGIISNPVVIKNMEITSLAMDENAFYDVGTRFGQSVFPYSRNGVYYSSKNVGPFRIYKRNTPYLYLTNDSGIRVIDIAEELDETGVSIPINTNKTTFTKSIDRPDGIGSMQLWVMHKENFSSTPVRMFEINGKTETVEFVVVADSSGQRGMVYARNKNTKTIYENIRFYQNGIRVANPYIQKNEWAALGIEFTEVINIDNYAGSINLLGGTVFNNISYYIASGLGRNENTIGRPWIRVLEDVSIYDSGVDPPNATYFDSVTGNIKWEYWYSGNPEGLRWSNVFLVKQDPTYVVTPEDIYAAFTGTNINIVDDDSGVSIFNDKLLSISNISWSLLSDTPA